MQRVTRRWCLGATRDDLLSAEPDDVAVVFVAAQVVAVRLVAALGLEGVTLFQADRAAGWQDVGHLHVHVVARWAGDGLVRPWSGVVAGDDELAAGAAGAGVGAGGLEGELPTRSQCRHEPEAASVAQRDGRPTGAR